MGLEISWLLRVVAVLVVAAYGLYCSVRMHQNRIPGFVGLLGQPGSLNAIGMRYSRRFTICWVLAMLLILSSWFW